MRNCFFEDCDLSNTVYLWSFVDRDMHGYFIEVRVNQNDVIKLMKQGVIPKYDEANDIFKLSIRINNTTKFLLNGLRVSNLSDERLQSIPIPQLTLKELSLKRYSKNTSTWTRGKCYAIRIIVNAKIPRRHHNA